MRDSFGSNPAQPSPVGRAIAGVRRIKRWRTRRPLVMTLATAAAVLVCSTHAAVAAKNTIHAAGIGYLCLALVMFGCACAFWSRARSATGTLYIRWFLISVAALAASIGYAPSFTQYIFNSPPERVFQTACFNASEALYLLAGVLFFAGVGRSIVLVDTLQAFLFVLLRFNLVYSPVRSGHFTADHLIIGQFVALFLFLVAIVGRLGAASRAEADFLRTLAWFFGLRLVGFFLSNQVSYAWLNYGNCSLWDVPGPALLAAFSLYLFHSPASARSQGVDAEPHASSLLVRSLMPSFLALVNLMLGLFLLRISVPLAAVAISVSLVCYVVRTGLLQAQAMRDKTLLQLRNQQLEDMAIRDPLTGIGNRRSLAAAYSRIQATAGGETLSLLLTDIDYFKQANDFHGHMHGDKVLIALARKLERLAAGVPGSHCARLGGDEFALLLPAVTPQQSSTLAEELRTLFSSEQFATPKSRVSISVGIASLQAARDLPLETLACSADEALYRAKQLGRNRVEVQPAWESGTASDPATQLQPQHIPG